MIFCFLLGNFSSNISNWHKNFIIVPLYNRFHFHFTYNFLDRATKYGNSHFKVSRLGSHARLLPLNKLSWLYHVTLRWRLQNTIFSFFQLMMIVIKSNNLKFYFLRLISPMSPKIFKFELEQTYSYTCQCKIKPWS